MIKKIIGVLFIIVLIGVGSWYYVGYDKYESIYLEGTHYAGIDISNLTKDEAITQMEEKLGEEEVVIKENGEVKLKIKFKDVLEGIDLGDGLTTLLDKQDRLLWFMGSKNKKEVSNEAVLKISRYEIENQLKNNQMTNKYRTLPKDARIEYTEGKGFNIVGEVEGDTFKTQELIESIHDGIQYRKEVNIEDYYEEPKVKKDDDVLIGRLKEIKEIVNSGIKIRLNKEEISIPKETIESWVLFNSDGTLDLDYDLIYAYVEELNETYSTYGKPMEFESVLQGEVEVQAGTYGWSIEVDQTATIIYQGVLNKEPVVEPVILGIGYGEDLEDVLYVEVDLTYQKMFIVNKGEVILETDIVSGRPGAETVPGAYAVWDKQVDAVLRGYNVHTQRDYEQPVTYWMPFDDTGQGIHDANWQSVFGGDVYTYGGSQGCINTPPYIMGDVFNLIEVGTPVIIF